MPFARSVVRLAERADIQPALKKLWKKHYKVDGQITQHLSPFEQKIVAPLFKDAHVKILKNFLEKAIEAGPGLGLGVAVFFWGNSYFDQCAYDHRP